MNLTEQCHILKKASRPFLGFFSHGLHKNMQRPILFRFSGLLWTVIFLKRSMWISRWIEARKYVSSWHRSLNSKNSEPCLAIIPWKRKKGNIYSLTWKEDERLANWTSALIQGEPWWNSFDHIVRREYRSVAITRSAPIPIPFMW